MNDVIYHHIPRQLPKSPGTSLCPPNCQVDRLALDTVSNKLNDINPHKNVDTLENKRKCIDLAGAVPNQIGSVLTSASESSLNRGK